MNNMYKKFKANNKRKGILTINTRKHKQIRQKQSLVHKVPSEVVILSHVCGVAVNIPLHLMYLSGKYERQENLVFYRWKMEWESPPSILVTRNPN